MVGQKPRSWGPSTWRLLHFTAAWVQKHPVYIPSWWTFFHYMVVVLPCIRCRCSVQKCLWLLQKTQTYQPQEVLEFTYDLHLLVTAKLWYQSRQHRSTQRAPRPLTRAYTWTQCVQDYDVLDLDQLSTYWKTFQEFVALDSECHAQDLSPIRQRALSEYEKSFQTLFQAMNGKGEKQKKKKKK